MLDAKMRQELELNFKHTFNRLVDCDVDASFELAKVALDSEYAQGFANSNVIFSNVSFSLLYRVQALCVGTHCNMTERLFAKYRTVRKSAPSKYRSEPIGKPARSYPSQASRKSNKKSSRTCFLPTSAEFLQSYDEQVPFDVKKLTQLENLPCAPKTQIQTTATILVKGDIKGFDSHQQEWFSQSVLQTYNELNALNGDTCDRFSRVVVSAHINAGSSFYNSNGRSLRMNQDRLLDQGSNYFNIYLVISATCNGCTSNQGLFDYVSGRRRWLEKDAGEGATCFCPLHFSTDQPPSPEAFQEALGSTVTILF